MFHRFNYILVLLCNVNHLFSYTIEYKNSEKFCDRNPYSHIYNYLQENSYCFRIQWCSEDHCCEHECGKYSLRAQQIRILETELIPPHAFKNSLYLRRISGIQKNIKTLASNSFVDLPSLEDVNLSFNLIRYLHHDVFKNVTAKSLDLSYNKIIYIEQDAFFELPNLEVLNLQYNELSYIYSFPQNSVLKDLFLGHNFLQRLVISSVRYPQLQILEVSFNNLTNIAITSNNIMKLINLESNDLQNLDIFEIRKVEELNIGMNQFNDLKNVENVQVDSISLYPNPWSCTTLNNLVTKYKSVSKKDSDYPRCVHESTTESEYKLDYSSEKPATCFENKMCSDDKICRSNQCINPCLNNACHSTNICDMKNHQFTCSCPGSQKKNPVELNSICYDVECFVDADCPAKIPCNKITYKCDNTMTIGYSKASSVVRTYPWFYDEIDPVLGKTIYVQNFHRTEKTNYKVLV